MLKNNKKLGVILIFIIAIILFSLSSTALQALTSPQSPNTPNGDENLPTVFSRKPNTNIGSNDVQNGKMNLGNAKEIRAGLQEKVDSSYITNRISVNPVFQNGKSEGNFMIENIEQNKFLVQVEVFLEDNNQMVYQSPILSPGQYIERAKLTKPLEKGTYKAIAYFNVFTQDTQKYISRSGVKITLTIKN